MPIDVAISGNSFSWTLQKADLGVNESVATAVGGGLSVMNMAIARGALLASDYAARMMKQTQAVADDVESLKSMQGLL